MSDEHIALIDVGRYLGEAGLAPGTTGNLSVRVGDRVFVTATGARLGDLTSESIAELSLDGSHLGGGTPTKESVLHLETYRRRVDAAAIVHLHSPAALAVSCLAELPDRDPLPSYTPYYVMRAGRVRTVDYYPPGDRDLASAVAEALEDVDAVLLRRHGTVCLGSSLAAAMAAAEELEANCDIHLRIGARRSDPLDDEEIAALLARRK